MDPEKVRAVVDFPQPTSRVQLQSFLGFAHFYRRFIWDYSTLAATLSALTSPKVPFTWSPAVDRAFWDLKHRFTSAPILIHLDPSRQVVVEVDASDIGVGAILSQQSAQDQKLRPCAFLYHRLNPVERNDDIGNRELLAVKMLLEEWRHWLEGAEHPFLVWTDHKNLEYLRTTKLLNSRQAHWALLFTSFNFTISYRPGSRNVKLDALSRLYSSAATQPDSETILPTSCVAATVVSGIEHLVRKAQLSQPDPGRRHG